MHFIDLVAQQSRIRSGIDRRIKAVLDHGQYIMGPEVAELESKLSKYVGVNHCLSCSNGTDALLIPLLAHGVGPGDAVLVPSFTFFATAEVVSLAGAKPIFVDVDPTTFNICPKSLRDVIERAKRNGEKLRAIIPVDLFGLPAPYAAIHEIAKEHDLFVLEDAAQSFGASYLGSKACSLSNIAATSFFPAKPLGCYGDGGAIFCDDAGLKSIMTSIRVHGQGRDKYENIRIGINGRLDTIQAAILLEKLTIFDDEIKRRNAIATRYTSELSKIVETPSIPVGYTSAWAQYTIKVKNRDRLVGRLKERCIPTMMYYPIPIHLQDAYRCLGYKSGSLPVSESLCKEVLSIPMHPYLSEQDQDQIVKGIKESL